MKIIFYGAGAMASLYAVRLKKSGNDVSVLSWGQRVSDIREHGIILENIRTRSRTITRLNVVERLESEDAYDLVVVMMPKNQVSEILPLIAANRHTPNVLFMSNGVTVTDDLMKVLESKRVLVGYPGSLATREGNIVWYMILPEYQQPTTFSEPDGSTTPRLIQIASVFKRAGFPVSINSQTDKWPNTHVVHASPISMIYTWLGMIITV